LTLPSDHVKGPPGFSCRRPRRESIRRWTGALVLCVGFALAYAADLSGQLLSVSQIDAAIQAGQSGKEGQLFSRCQAIAGLADRFRGDRYWEGVFDLSFSLTPGQIAELSGASRRLYKPFLLSDVPVALKRLAVFVSAEPHEPKAGDNRAVPAIEQIVLRSQVKRDLIVQPDEFAAQPVDRPKYPGAQLQPNRAQARFPVGGVREFPPGEFDIVVVTEAGERRCKVGSGDRRRLFE
jgi:hypothetical protein